MKCLYCEKEFISKSNVNKFCTQSCAASYNNSIRTTKRDRVEHNCINCGTLTKNRVYCSTVCGGTYRRKVAYELFISTAGEGFSYYNGPKQFKKQILEEQDCRCSVCNNLDIWNEKKLVFILDHIDGDSGNNRRDNLRLVCPNCDSQLDTYKAKNKGKGRFERNKRRLEGKSS